MDIRRHLDNLSPDDLRGWLGDALHERHQLPKLTHDEPPDVAILRVEPTLDRITRRDLGDACVRLVHDLTGSPEVDEEYLRALLGLAVGLDLRDRVAPLLYTMASQTAEFDRLPHPIRRVVLEGLLNLRSLQPPEFWRAHYERAPSDLALTALAGLLSTSWHEGVAFIRDLDPHDQRIAFGAATLLEQALEDLPPAERGPCTRELQDLWNTLPRDTDLREALTDIIGPERRPGPAATPRERTPHRSPDLVAAYTRVLDLSPPPQRIARLVDPRGSQKPEHTSPSRSPSPPLARRRGEPSRTELVAGFPGIPEHFEALDRETFALRGVTPCKPSP